MRFIIFHGAYGNPEGNWFPELKEKLENLGQEVLIPKFPVDNFDEISRKVKPKYQNLENWFKVFEKIVKRLDGKICFVGHSLGPLFILHVVDKYNLKLDSAIFVSPFMRKLDDYRFDNVNKTFYKTNFNFKKLRKLIPISYVLYSDNDPYVDKKHSLEFAKKMNSSLILVNRAGHMNSEVNLNEFPLAYELCKSRIDMSLYQHYLAHRRELYSIPYVRGKGEEEVVYLDPKDVFDEGVFHFRNLKNEGFCTFYSALKFWDIQSKYMEEARKAAKRTKNLTRVFVIDKMTDLKKPLLLKQIKLDIAAEVKTYLCFFGDVKKYIEEPDFGIWDNEYLCIVKFDKNKEVSEVKLSSRKIDMKNAEKWKHFILKKSKRIFNIDKDVKKFIMEKSR